MFKKIVSLSFVLLLLVTLSACGKNEEATNPDEKANVLSFSNGYEPVEYDNFTDLGDGVIYVECSEDVTEEALAWTAERNDAWDLSCTSLANINSKGELIIGRNNDNEISEYPLYVIKNTGGRYETFNLYYMSDGSYTYEEILEAGHLNDEVAAYCAFLATDAMNEKGLYIEINMRYAGLDGIANSGTNPGKQRASTMTIPNLVAQNCATVDEAIEFLNDSYDYYTVESAQFPWVSGWDAGFLIGDAEGNYGVIEIANNKVTYTPDVSVNANYYFNEEFASYDVNACGTGRAAIIADKVKDVETIEDAMDLIEVASWYHEVLDIEYSYKDENGVHFVDKDGNPSFDYRDELPGTFLVDEDGNIVYETGYEDDYDAFQYYCYIGDFDSAAEYREGYDKQMEYYQRCTSEFMMNDDNFDQVKAAYLDYFGHSKELLLNYFDGDYEPLIEDGWVFTTGYRTGVNCMKKEMVVEIFERDDLILKYSFE